MTSANGWRSLLKSPLVLLGLVMLMLVVLMAFFAPWVAPYDPNATTRVTIDMIYARPDAAHWLGTDDAGRDVLTNLIYGRTRLPLSRFFCLLYLAVYRRSDWADFWFHWRASG